MVTNFLETSIAGGICSTGLQACGNVASLAAQQQTTSTPEVGQTLLVSGSVMTTNTACTVGTTAMC